jgi:hypothetical protein
MKKAFVVIAAMVMALTVAGIANADPIENATGPEVLNASGSATFSATSGNPAVSCTGEDGITYQYKAPAATKGTLTDGDSNNDLAPSTNELSLTATGTNPGPTTSSGLIVTSGFTFNGEDGTSPPNGAIGRGGGVGTFTIWPNAGGKTGTHRTYKVAGTAYFVLQVIGIITVNSQPAAKFLGRGLFYGTISKWNANTSKYVSTGHNVIINGEFQGYSSLGTAGSSIAVRWGSTFDNAAVVGGFANPSPTFQSPLPADDMSILTTIPGKHC